MLPDTSRLIAYIKIPTAIIIPIMPQIRPARDLLVLSSNSLLTLAELAMAIMPRVNPIIGITEKITLKIPHTIEIVEYLFFKSISIKHTPNVICFILT